MRGNLRMIIPITFIVPTLNEEQNIGQTLASITNWVDEVYVLDSFSSDQTCELARRAGAYIAQHRFENFSAQKNWALDNLPFRNEWIFFLDADERVTSTLRDEITKLFADGGPPLDGYYVGRMNHFMGRWIRYAGMYPNWNLRMFRHHFGRYEQRIVHEHVILKGRIGYLREPLFHDDYKGLERYFDRHNSYSSMEALEVWKLLTATEVKRIKASLFARGPERRRALKHAAYRYLPCRALVKFVWMFFLSRGFLDGRIGFRYCLLQAFYEYQVSLKIQEIEANRESPIFRYAEGSERLSDLRAPQQKPPSPMKTETVQD
jgi:glycosyltransferase involved in cell wall biosynthesis